MTTQKLYTPAEREELIDDYVMSRIAPFAVFNAHDGEHLAILDILEDEDATRLVYIQLPIYGRAKVHIGKVYDHGDKKHVKQNGSKIYLNLFTSKHEGWEDVINA